NEKNSWYNDVQYNHSALQPIYSEDTTSYQKSNRKYWFGRKLYDEHLVQIIRKEATLNIDFMPDIYIGKDFNNAKNIWTNTRGIRMFGTVDKNFSFDLNIYENQAVFPIYFDSITRVMQTIPGQVWHKFAPQKSFDYSYTQGHISYKSGSFHFLLGNDKLFIGDGYRSLLISDVSVPFPYFRATYENNKFQYSSIYMQHIDLKAPVLSNDIGFRRKWAVMHYLNWNISTKFSLGLFDALIWQDDDTTGKRGFDVQYVNPIIFLRAVEYMNHSTDNAIIGINFKYRISKEVKLYAQFALDELKIDEYFKQSGWWANKYAFQIGINFFTKINEFKIMGFSEFNTARPYMYTHNNTLKSYTNYNDALAHPLGANFIENVSRLELQYRRFGFLTQLNYAVYGLDSVSGNTNVGSNIFASYDTRDKEYGNKLLQGIPASLFIVDARIAYMLNPKINMRLELGYTYRNEIVSGTANLTNIITFGLRSSFRNLYFDR
ncbi:MAG: hypothetical protein K9I48_09080, partial [Sphingobacteriales bacterium]|nr:hypothetical protein [Sphingobacteriales bacterium]